MRTWVPSLNRYRSKSVSRLVGCLRRPRASARWFCRPAPLGYPQSDSRGTLRAGTCGELWNQALERQRRRARSRKANTSQAPSARQPRPQRNGQRTWRDQHGIAHQRRALRSGDPLPPFDTYPAIAIEDVQPELDGGRWPIKRVVGDIGRGLGRHLQRRPRPAAGARAIYRALASRPGTKRRCATDRERSLAWVSSRSIDNTRYVYGVLAFTDVFGSWRADFQKRLAAAQDLSSELLEGCAWSRRPSSDAPISPIVGACKAYVKRGDHSAIRLPARGGRAGHLGRAWRGHGPLARSHRRHALPARAATLIVDRPAARFAAWYEIFPRSQGTDPDAQRDVPRSRSAPAGDCAPWASTPCT